MLFRSPSSPLRLSSSSVSRSARPQQRRRPSTFSLFRVPSIDTRLVAFAAAQQDAERPRQPAPRGDRSSPACKDSNSSQRSHKPRIDGGRELWSLSCAHDLSLITFDRGRRMRTSATLLDSLPATTTTLTRTPILLLSARRRRRRFRRRGVASWSRGGRRGK